MLKPTEKQRILTYVSGLLYYYGVVELTDLSQMITEHLPVKLTVKELMVILDEVLLDEDSIYYFEKEGNYYYWLDVDDIERVIEEQAARPSISWRPVSEAEARHIIEGSSQHLWDEQTKKFFDFLYDNSDDEKEEEAVVAMVEDLAVRIRNDASFEELISAVAEYIGVADEEVFQLLVETVMEFYNHQQQWILKGWSPQEAREKFSRPKIMKAADNVVPLRTKVGRNEPCPCGSGKKYKKCCLPKSSDIQEAALTLSPEEYEALAVLAYIGDWVINSCELSEDREELYTEVYKKVCSQAGKFGKETMVSYSPENNFYELDSEYGDEGLAMEFIEDFENNVFWDELTSRLAKRDLLREYGIEAIEKMDVIERFMKLQELEASYNDVFCDQGLEALVLEEKK